MKFARKKNLHDVVELNITAFMNLMVILVPFLLITAVFSRMTVLELNLPALDQAQAKSADKLDLVLELVVREKSFDLQDANLGQLHRIERNQQGQNWEDFTKVLMEIKSRYPEEKSIMLLMEPGVSYKTMIEIMDHVRSTQVVQIGNLVEVELFPDISISDAPALEFATETISQPGVTTDSNEAGTP
jgi:biopolymer transport protein ExbD